MKLGVASPLKKAKRARIYPRCDEAEEFAV
jgi:hypothetical protein